MYLKKNYEAVRADLKIDLENKKNEIAILNLSSAIHKAELNAKDAEIKALKDLLSTKSYEIDRMQRTLDSMISNIGKQSNIIIPTEIRR